MLILVCALMFGADSSDDAARRAKWEKEVSGIETRLKAKPPAKHGVVFAGSSSIRLWKQAESFPKWPTANVGFGGSQIPDSTLFAARLIVPHEPELILFYAGDNDINAKRTPKQVANDFAVFTDTIHAKLPKTRIGFLAIKPSLARWNQHPQQTEANGLVKTACAKNPLLIYLDTVTPMLGTDGKPKPEFFVKDGLHMTDAGYKVWTSLVMDAKVFEVK